MAVLATNSFEGGSDEVDISAANSGGASGTAFTTVVKDASNNVKYDTARAAHGTVSCRINVATANRAAVDYDNPVIGTVTELWGRLYYYNTAIPSVGIRLASIHNSAGTRQASIEVPSNGKLRVADSASVSDDTVANIPLNQWIRIEFHVLHSATVGQIEAKLYTLDNTSPITDGTVSSPATRNTGTNSEEAVFGNSNFNAQTLEFWIDDLQINTDGWPGPYGSAIEQQFSLPWEIIGVISPTALGSLSSTQNIVRVYQQTRVPLATDDSSGGYAIGDIWIYNQQVWWCVSSATNSAVWKQV